MFNYIQGRLLIVCNQYTKQFYYFSVGRSHEYTPFCYAEVNRALCVQTFVAVAVCLTAAAYGYPTGAPEPACSSLAPIHANTTPQPTPSPYSINVDKSNWLSDRTLMGKLWNFAFSQNCMLRGLNCYFDSLRSSFFKKKLPTH